MPVKYRIIAINLAEKIGRDKAYAERIGISVEIKRIKKKS